MDINENARGDNTGLNFKKLLRNGLHRQCIGFHKTRKILFKQKSKLTQSQNVPKV